MTYYYKYEEFEDDILSLKGQVAKFNPDTILAIARGGVTLGHFLSERLGLRNLYTLNSIHYDDKSRLDTIDIFNIPLISDNSRVLVVDDIVDSGDTMIEVMEILREKYPKSQFRSATIFYKEDASYRPDFKCREANMWIEFFWSKNLIKFS
jgi:xanthine phosphoribosyltransferase